jgi:two-component system chemotaxis sensor kinase CheA
VDRDKYAALFATEAREHLAEINAGLATIQAELTAGALTSSAVQSAVATIFRSVHTIKGMAAAMAYGQVVECAHAFESELDAVRSGARSITPLFVAQMYEEADALAREIDAALGVAPDEIAASQQESVEGEERSPRLAFGQHTDRQVRIKASRLDALMDLTGELEIARGQLEHAVQSLGNPDALKSHIARFSRLIRELRDQVVSTRMVPVGQIFEQFPRVVRETARSLGKEIEFRVEGATIELDRSMLDAISDPILHLLRNAVDHGIELPDIRTANGKPAQGRITLSASRESNFVLISVKDDGGGIDRDRILKLAFETGLLSEGEEFPKLSDRELLDVLSRPGFSTAHRVTDVSGRGVGLDVVDATVRTLGGGVSMTSVVGEGTEITLRLPLTVAIIRALLVRLDTEIFAMPITNIVETVEIARDTVHVVAGAPAARVRDSWVPVVQLRKTVGLPSQNDPFARAVTVEVRGRRAAVVVDEFVGQQDIVVKQLDIPIAMSDERCRVAHLFSGATILSDGAPALILDVNSLVQSALTPGGNIP